MSDDESGRRGGKSWTGEYDTETKSARPKSVGPHDVKREQEDPGDGGIEPEEGYGAEIARNNAAKEAGPEGSAKGPVVAPQPKAETGDESGGTEEMLRKSGPARDAPPLTGTAQE